jgi:hypothetical protein
MKKSVPFFLFIALAMTAAGQVQQQVELKPPPKLPPTITRVTISHPTGYPVAAIHVMGRSFGAEKDHRLLMDGVPAERDMTWQDHIIYFLASGPVERVPHSHEFTIVNAGGQVVSNRFRVSFLATWDGGSAIFGAPESEVTLRCWGAGIQQGGRMIHLGNTPMEVLSWQHDGRGQNQIRVKIPKVAPGSYQIVISEGGDKISEPGGFMVR